MSQNITKSIGNVVKFKISECFQFSILDCAFVRAENFWTSLRFLQTEKFNSQHTHTSNPKKNRIIKIFN